MALGVAGLLLSLWGVRQLVGVDVVDVVEIAAWLAGGVLVHDAVLAPAVVLVGWVMVRRLPERARAPFAVAGVVLGTVTLAVLPTLARFGAKDDDPYLLNRAYGLWWLLLAVLLLTGAAGWTVARTRSGGAESPPRPGPAA